MSQALVLAIEPDLRQAAIVKRIVREKALADVAVVDSLDAAIEAMRTAMPDVLLLSALLSPRDEDHLIAHLKTLDQAGHLQTHTIPQLASTLQPDERRAGRGLLSAFRRKKEPASLGSGCDPDLFADEIRMFLQRAADKKRELQHPNHAALDMRPRPAGKPRSAPAQAEATPAAPSSWSSPFEWKPSSPSSVGPDPVSAISHDELPVSNPDAGYSEPLVSEPTVSEAAAPEPVLAEYVAGEPVLAEPSWAEPVFAQPTTVDEPSFAEAPLPEPASTAANSEDLMAHLRPPSGIANAQQLVAEAAAERFVPADVRMETPPVEAPPPVLVAEPVQVTAPVQPRVSAERPRRSVKKTGLGIRDLRSTINDKGLGALAGWARSEDRARDAAQGSDDLRAMLTGLAVPPAVVSVGYGRGVRIRRVRVLATREHHETEAVGAVIISRRVLAEQRDLRDQHQA